MSKFFGGWSDSDSSSDSSSDSEPEIQVGKRLDTDNKILTFVCRSKRSRPLVSTRPFSSQMTRRTRRGLSGRPRRRGKQISTIGNIISESNITGMQLSTPISRPSKTAKKRRISIRCSRHLKIFKRTLRRPSLSLPRKRMVSLQGNIWQT